MGSDRNRKERQIIHHPVDGGALVLGFQLGQDHLGAVDHRMRQACQLGHLNPVAAVGHAGDHFMQKHHIAAIFGHAQGQQMQTVELFGQCRQFVEMGGKQATATVLLVQMFNRRPGNRQAVIGGGATADFIENHQRPFGRLIENGSGFDHFDHEGRTAPRQIIGGADA